jgi:hypothetical protein
VAPQPEPAQARSAAYRAYPVSEARPDRDRAAPAVHPDPDVRRLPCPQALVRFGNSSRTAPATSETIPTTGGNATPSRFSVATSNGPASRIVSRSVQNTPPQTSATIPITTSTRPTICLTDTPPSRRDPYQAPNLPCREQDTCRSSTGDRRSRLALFCRNVALVSRRRRLRDSC